MLLYFAFIVVVNPKNVKTSKSFYKTFKPFFSSKYSPLEKLILVENQEIISNDLSCAELINNYFRHITDSLNIPQWPTTPEIESIHDPIRKAICKYQTHPSILNICSNFDNSTTFNFTLISHNDVIEEIKHLDISKSSSGNIPLRIVKEYASSYLYPLTECFNNELNK